MGVLSFPAGLVCVILSAIVCGLAVGEFPSPYIAGWLLLACGGCLQWHIIVPVLLEEPKLTLLNLNAFSMTSKIPLATAGVSANSPIDASQTLAAPVINLPRKRRKRKRHHRVVGFDKFGRTPLERIIHRHSTDASA